MTTKTELIEKELTLKWFQANNAICKFNEEEGYYDLSDAVTKLDLEKLGIKGGSKVKVKIDTTQGENGTVVFLQPNDVSDKKEEPKQETQSDVFTIGFIHWKNKAVVFEEKEGVWYSLEDDVLELLKANKVTSKQKVTFTDKNAEGKSKNRIITSIYLVEDKKEEVTKESTEDVKKSNPKNDYDKNRNNVQTSIEAQASLNSACSIVASIVNSESSPEEVMKIIKRLAIHNFELVQELKNKS